MDKELSFMSAIDRFDKIAKNSDAREDIKEYALAMKKLFSRLEKAKVSLQYDLNKIENVQ